MPLVHPCDKSLIGITEQVRRDELDLVQNAAFTDPEDSSAWFYHRWLLASTEHADTPKIWVARKVKPGVAVAISKDVKGGYGPHSSAKAMGVTLRMAFTFSSVLRMLGWVFCMCPK